MNLWPVVLMILLLAGCDQLADANVQDRVLRRWAGVPVADTATEPKAAP